MDAIEQQSGARAVKHARARRADEKGGAGVVAEGERALGLAARETAVAVKLRDSRRAERIAARDAEQKGTRARAADAEQPRRYRGEQAAEHARQTELPQQGGENEKRQQRRYDHLRAEG